MACHQFRQQASPQDWQIFARCRLQGETSTALAEELGQTSEAVRKRLQRAGGKLRQILQGMIGSLEQHDAWL